ncbi:hypothetical protein FZC76_13760 [Sutcliffiella horikoshii]|uniref:Uncharacterized protein n=1 Tax=Sutcliffiella horikoshii TaxID=79883 RepID=A0A5D4T0K3_9BACI|nr:sporulation protein [Sutcliffiella horikoshii]TYS67636.1 hypothetical protein FZC76_13760 [Sutcliffiella horikoshii]
MSLFSKLITSVGIGSAKVDTKLKKNYFMQGEVLDGVVGILGGSSNQKIDAIHLKLMTLHGHEGSSRLTNTVIHTHKLNDSFTIHAGERKEIPFSFPIPLDTPITMQDPETGKIFRLFGLQRKRMSRMLWIRGIRTTSPLNQPRYTSKSSTP